MGTKKIKKLIPAAITGLLLLTGCQETPEQSAVVSKAEGLPEKAVAKAMKEGETTVISLPKQWTASELRSNDRVTIQVDLSLSPIEVGNLPVIEMKNHSMSQEELKKLVEYFAGEQTLYEIEQDTKQDYEKVMERIRNGEGAYADPTLASYYRSNLANLESAAELAAEEDTLVEIKEIRFQENPRGEAYYVAAGIEVPEKNQESIFFSVDVGEDREAHIIAQNYQESVGNSSSFQWYQGDEIWTASDISFYMELAERSAGGIGTEYDKQWLERVAQFEAAVEKETFSEADGLTQAQTILKELGIEGLELSAVQNALWFPKGTYALEDAAAIYDELWQADLEQAECGYEFCFSRGEGGLFADEMERSYTRSDTYESYAPPFPVEKISVVVTETGVKSFSWEGMCEEVAVIAENTSLLSFDSIQEKLFDYIYYRYTYLGQPSNSTAKLIYTIYDVKLGYSYVTAYGNPQNAWLVPTWFFKVDSYMDAEESGLAYTMGTEEFMVNALDGGFIGKQY